MSFRALFGLLALCVLVRLALALTGIGVTADSIAYQISAAGLVNELFPDFRLVNSDEYGFFVGPNLLEHNARDFFIERTPGFPLLMAGLMILLHLAKDTVTTAMVYQGVIAVNALLGCVSALLGTGIASRLFGDKRLALALGAAIGLWPTFLWQEHQVMSETLYMASLLLYLWLFFRGSSPWMLGVSAAWLVLIRPVGLAVPVATALWWLVNRRRQPTPIRAWIALLLPVAGAWLLWSGFNLAVHDTFRFTAGLGMNQLYKVIDLVDFGAPENAEFRRKLGAYYEQSAPRYAAVNTLHTWHVIAENRKPPEEQRPIFRLYLEDDRQALPVALDTIARHPVQYLVITVREFFKTLLVPHEEMPLAQAWPPVLLLAVIGAFILVRKHDWRSPTLFPLWLALFQIGLTVLLTLGHPRYRLPLEPVFLIPALYALFALSGISPASPETPEEA